MPSPTPPYIPDCEHPSPRRIRAVPLLKISNFDPGLFVPVPMPTLPALALEISVPLELVFHCCATTREECAVRSISTRLNTAIHILRVLLADFVIISAFFLK